MRSKRAIEVLEAFADGLATSAQMEEARLGSLSADGGWGNCSADAPAYSAAAYAEAASVGYITHFGMLSKANLSQEGVRCVRDIFGHPFRPVTFSPSWRTDTSRTLAQTMYESRDFSAMPILADALQDAGCDSAEILDHCRGLGPHVRGCWVVDLILDRE